MCSAILLYQTALAHINTAILHQLRKGVFKSAEVLSFTKTGFGCHSVKFYKVIIKTFRSINLTGSNFTCVFIISDYSLGSLSSRRCPKLYNFGYGGLLVCVKVGPETFFFYQTIKPQ